MKIKDYNKLNKTDKPLSRLIRKERRHTISVRIESKMMGNMIKD